MAVRHVFLELSRCRRAAAQAPIGMHELHLAHHHNQGHHGLIAFDLPPVGIARGFVDIVARANQFSGAQAPPAGDVSGVYFAGMPM